jgi:alkylation response protein AidB-like acyl-CoA dehydrogenase
VQRVQFGKPIGTFQAVQHRLAEVYVELETTERLIDLAGGDAILAAAAKISAGRLADVAVKSAQQVLGGVGFTAASAYHRYAKRVLLLDKLCGSDAHLARAMGEFLLRADDVPRLPQLSLERAARSLAQT